MRFSLLLSLIGPALGAIAPPQIPLSSQPAPVASASDFTTFQSTISPNHSIRIKRQNATLCDTPVDQYTGWLDVGHKHFFFWYFASENASPSPDSAPLALWMTGGPGGSSMIGLLLELGPCLMNKNGDGTVYNPYGWNKDTAMIFVDQPVGVGFSYSDHDDTLPDNSFSSAEDMQIFLQTFISQVFPVHLKGPFVITGESYAGHYIPTLGAQIVKQNLLYPHHPQVPLKSVAIGNGLISRPDTIFGYWETLCTTNPGVPEPVFNQTRCDIMAANMPRCVDILKTCNSHPDPALCGAAETVCVDEVTGHYEREVGIGGRNPYDITAPCDVDEICYADADLITKYLNLESSFRTLGVPPAIKNYSIMSPEVERAFSRTVDIQISTEPQVHYLLSNQVDVLIYQGNLDLVCNTAGAQRWASNFQWKGQAEFTAKSMKPWASVVNGTKTEVGTFKEVNIKMVEGDEKTTRFALVTVDGSGHMVPLDQPEVALDLLTRWLAGKSFD